MLTTLLTLLFEVKQILPLENALTFGLAIFALSFNAGDPVRAGFLGLAYSLGLGLPFLLVALGFGWATTAIGFLRRHIRVINIIGGVLLIALGVLMATGLWTDIMSRLTAVMNSVILPL